MPPLFRSLARVLSDRLKGLGAFLASGIWWLCEWAGDKLFGDAAFTWLRTMLSPLSEHQWLSFAWAYGPPICLFALGIYYFYRAGKPQLSVLDSDPRMVVVSPREPPPAQAVIPQSIERPPPAPWIVGADVGLRQVMFDEMAFTFRPCRFVNVSADREAVVDLAILVEPQDGSPPFMVSTEGSRHNSLLGSEQRTGFLMPPAPELVFPLRLKPRDIVEGDIRIKTLPHIIQIVGNPMFLFTHKVMFRVTDHLAGRSIEFQDGEGFDARTMSVTNPRTRQSASP